MTCLVECWNLIGPMEPSYRPEVFGNRAGAGPSPVLIDGILHTYCPGEPRYVTTFPEVATCERCLYFWRELQTKRDFAIKEKLDEELTIAAAAITIPDRPRNK